MSVTTLDNSYVVVIHLLEDVTSVEQHERQHSYQLRWLPRMQQAGRSQQFMYSTALFTLPALQCDQCHEFSIHCKLELSASSYIYYVVIAV